MNEGDMPGAIDGGPVPSVACYKPPGERDAKANGMHNAFDSGGSTAKLRLGQQACWKPAPGRAGR